MLASAARQLTRSQPKNCLGRRVRYSSKQDPAWWNEELDRRRSAPGTLQRQALKQETRNSRDDLEPGGPRQTVERQDLQQSASDMQLFAYAESRRLPWATLLLLLLSGGATFAVTALWAKVSQAQSLEELQEQLRNFCWVISRCSVSLPQLQAGEIGRLFTASLLRAGEQPARLVADTVLFVCCGTLLERLYGSAVLLQLVVGSTLFCNVSALCLHQRLVGPGGDPVGSISSSSAAVVTLGTFCALRHGRWAAWRGVPVPVSWLMAPVLVGDLSLAWGYLHDLIDCRHRHQSVEPVLESTESVSIQVGHDSGIQRSIALAACFAVEDAARSRFQPPAQDIVSWRVDLENTVEEEHPPPPEGAVLADAVGACLGAGLAVIFARASRR